MFKRTISPEERSKNTSRPITPEQADRFPRDSWRGQCSFVCESSAAWRTLITHITLQSHFIYLHSWWIGIMQASRGISRALFLMGPGFHYQWWLTLHNRKENSLFQQGKTIVAKLFNSLGSLLIPTPFWVTFKNSMALHWPISCDSSRHKMIMERIYSGAAHCVFPDRPRLPCSNL